MYLTVLEQQWVDRLTNNNLASTTIIPFFLWYIVKRCVKLSLERVIKALIGLGLSRVEAEVYVYLAKKGPQTLVDLTRDLK